MEGLAVLLLYLVIGAIVIVAGALLYARSVGSRKRYCCPQCGEQISVELMDASHCNVCGAALRGKMDRGQE
jgi:hypothetical protein